MSRLVSFFKRKLQRKLVRDLGSSKGLFIAVSVVIFLGVALFGASFLGYRNLKTSYDYSYEALHMADFTVSVVEAPRNALGELEALPDVEQVTGRINTSIVVSIPDEDPKRISTRFISLPADERPEVNDVKIEQGRYFEPDDERSMLIEKGYAEHHGLEAGDTIALIVDNKQIDFNIVGVVTSPEYIWPAKSRQEILVSFENWGVGFLPNATLAELTGSDSLNEFCFLVEDVADRDAVIADVEQVLSEYEVTDVVPLEEQPSNNALQLDLQEFGEMAEVFPLMFLVVGALATYILLTRVVQNQRSYIGLMRAIGYTRRQVLFHYLGFAIIIGLAGSIIGIIVGYLLGGTVTSLYVDILGLPYTRTEMGWVEWLAIEEGIAAGVIPSLIGGLIPALSASRLSPAEAMRPSPPTSGRKLLIERLLPFVARLSFLWKIPIRNIFRNRRRSLYTIIGVAFGIMLILVSAAFLDSFDAVFKLHFDDIQRSDARITFAEPQSESVLEQVRGWEEVDSAEPLLQVPARLVHGVNTYSTMALGISNDSELYGLYLTSGERVYVSEGEVLMSEALKGELDVATGDTITLDAAPYGSSEFEVAGFVKQALGSYGHLSIADLQGVVGGLPVANGVMVASGTDDLSALRDRAYSLPGGASVEITSELGDKVDEMLGLIRGIVYVMLAFGAALALAIVFTTVTISIVERRREIATMRTLGEGRGRIGTMITIENLVLGLTAVVPGIPLGYGAAILMAGLFQTDMMNFDVVIYARTYAMIVGIVVAIMLLSQLPGIRQVNRLDLAKVIKEQST